MNKDDFRSHISIYWTKYLIGFISSIVLSILIISIASSPTKKEKVSIFLTCTNVSDEFYDYINSITPSYLEIIELNIKHKEDTYYGTVIKGYRGHADIIIVPESKLDYIITKDSLVLSDDIMDIFTDKEYEYYYKDDKAIGIKIYSKETKSCILEDLVTFNKEDDIENYYLFINVNSLHLGELTNSKYDGVIVILKEILNYEKESGI